VLEFENWLEETEKHLILSYNKSSLLNDNVRDMNTDLRRKA